MQAAAADFPDRGPGRGILFAEVLERGAFLHPDEPLALEEGSKTELRWRPLGPLDSDVHVSRNLMHDDRRLPLFAQGEKCRGGGLGQVVHQVSQRVACWDEEIRRV